MSNLSEEESGVLAKVLPGRWKSAPYRGTSGMLVAYSKSPWVRAVVGKISESIGSTTWRMFATRSPSGKFVKDHRLQAKGISLKNISLGNVDTDNELIPIDDHPALRMLNQSNPMFPGLIGRTQTQISLELTGEAHWLLDPMPDGSSIPERFWFLPSTWIAKMPSIEHPYWELKTPAWEGKLPAPAIFRMVNPDPVNPYGRGTGYMRALGDEIDTDEYAAKYTKNWFLHQARPDLLITAEGLGQSETLRMETSWTQTLQSFRRAHKPFFLGKKVDVHQLSPKFSDMSMDTLRSWERDIIVHGIGMPPEILGIIENSNRATIEAADYLMGRYVLEPRLELQRTFLQYLLLPIYDDRLIIAYESPVQADREYQLQVMKAQPSAFKVNDWRAQAGFDPVDDGEVYQIPFNLRLAETLAPELPTGIRAAKLASGGSEVPDALPCGCQPSSQPDTGSAAEETKQSGTVWKIGGEANVEAAMRLSNEMQKELIKAFINLRNEIDLVELQRLFAAGNLEGAAALLSEADVAAALEDSVQVLKQGIVAAGEAAAAELSVLVGDSIAFSLTNPAAVDFINEFGASMVTNVTPATREAIRVALAEAYELGLTPAEAAKRVQESIGLTADMERQKARLIRDMLEAGASQTEVNAFIEKWTEQKIRWRAQLIAQNELVEAGNAGQELLWNQAGEQGFIDPTKATRFWITTPDDRLCVLCAPMSGAVTPLGMPFETPVGPVMTPNQIHVRCRCTEGLNVRG